MSKGHLENEDWAKRIRDGRTIIPKPLFKDSAERALAVFKTLKISDLPGCPTFGEVSEPWVFDFVAAVFGGQNPDTGKQVIREYGLLIAKKNTKSTIAAGIMMTALILCERQGEEHLILAPTREVADNSFAPCAGMIANDERLNSLFHVQKPLKIITNRVNGNTLKVVAAEAKSVAGKKSGRVLIDELWVFGSKAGGESILMEATGGLVSRPEGWAIYLTTQSDEPPAGVFKTKLDYWRDVRDGLVEDKATLPILYEYPQAMVEDESCYLPENFHISNPNLGRSVDIDWLESNLKRARSASDNGISLQKFAAKHFNVQMGMALRHNQWVGSRFWDACEAPLTLDDVIKRSEVITVGIDGGGLNDLLGLAVIGREKGTRKWLVWLHGWAHQIAIDRNKETNELLDFAKDGDLTIVQRPGDDVSQIAEVMGKLKKSRLLPKENALGVDAAGIGMIYEELTRSGGPITSEQVVAVSQGWKLNGAIKTTERMLAAGDIVHSPSAFSSWCVGNCKCTAYGNAVIITKQASGNGKIDPIMALFNAVTLMSLNPKPQTMRVVMTSV